MPPEKDEKDPNNALAEALGAINKTMESLPGLVQKSVGAGLKDALEGVRANNPAPAQKPEEEEDEIDTKNLEDLSRAEFMGVIGKMLGKEVKGLIKPLMERMDGLSGENEQERLTREIKEAQAKYSDFAEWKDEIRTSLQHPKRQNLSIDEHYRLVRGENTEKATEIDKKAKEEEEKQKEEELKASGKPGNQKQLFGGLTPTSGISNTEETGKMSSKEAAESAWDEVMHDMPNELIGQA